MSCKVVSTQCNNPRALQNSRESRDTRRCFLENCNVVQASERRAVVNDHQGTTAH